MNTRNLGAREIVGFIVMFLVLVGLIFIFIPFVRFAVPAIPGYVELLIGNAFYLGFGFNWNGAHVNGNAWIAISEMLGFIAFIVIIFFGLFNIGGKHRLFYFIGAGLYLIEAVSMIFYKDLCVASNANNTPLVLQALKDMQYTPYYIWEITETFIFSGLFLLLAFLPGRRLVDGAE